MKVTLLKGGLGILNNKGGLTLISARGGADSAPYKNIFVCLTHAFYNLTIPQMTIQKMLYFNIKMMIYIFI